MVIEFHSLTVSFSSGCDCSRVFCLHHSSVAIQEVLISNYDLCYEI